MRASRRPEPVMTLPCSAADVLAGHVLFEIEAIDRMYLNLYRAPRLPSQLFLITEKRR